MKVGEWGGGGCERKHFFSVTFYNFQKCGGRGVAETPQPLCDPAIKIFNSRLGARLWNAIPHSTRNKRKYHFKKLIKIALLSMIQTDDMMSTR